MSIPSLSYTDSIAISRFESFKPKENRITEIANAALFELATSLLIGAAACCFTAIPLGGVLIFSGIAVQNISNIALRYYGKSAEKNSWTHSICSYLCPTTFSYLVACNGQMLIHELGHAGAASLVFKNISPKIAIQPFWSSHTSYKVTTLTSIGKQIGKGNSYLFVYLMGPCTTLFISGIAITIGTLMKEKFPEFAYYLSRIGTNDFWTHGLYALTALLPSPSPTNDFANLAAYGIHPLATAVTLFAIPYLLKKNSSY